MDLVVLLLVIAITGVALMGWGYVALHLIGLDRPERPDVRVIWIGFALVVALVQVLHIVLPVDWKFSVLFTVIGLAIFLAYHGADVRCYARLITSAVTGHPWSAVLITIWILLFSAYAMATPWHYDSGLYHFAKIRWLNEYPIVPGLGNLHGRLAFNQSYFGFVALMNASPYWNHGHGAANFFLFLLTVATVLHTRLHRMADWLWVLVVLAITIVPLVRNMASPESDYVVALLQIVIFVFLLKTALNSERNGKDAVLYTVAVIVLSVTIVTVKLSAAMFGVATLVMALVLGARDLKMHTSMMVRTFSLCLVIGIVYVWRGYIESGVPFYPVQLRPCGIWSGPFP